MSKGTTRRTVRIEDGLWAAAQAAANERDENISDIIRCALTNYVTGMGHEPQPDEAVEAAARAHLDARGEAKWDDLMQMGRRNRLYWMRAALEAAAPFMLGTPTAPPATHPGPATKSPTY